MSAITDDVFRILVVIGAINDEDDVKYVLASIKAGILRWAQKLDILHAIDECLLHFEASNKSIVDEEGLAPFFKFTHSQGDITLTVLVSPTCYTVNQEIAELIITRCDRRLVVYGGHTINSQANWCFKDGVFAVEDLLYVLTDRKIVAALQRANVHPKLTISCCKASGWKLNDGSESSVEIEVIDPFQNKPDCEGERSPVTKGINTFTGKLEDVMAEQTQGIFSQLEPPVNEGFLKLRNPCIYIFPSGNGDSAFFTVNGFNILINGGALARPWFWRLVRHQDRVDCIIATHLGNDCLAGINSFLLRKLQERQIRLPMDSASPEYKNLVRCLLSPDLGVFFMNAPRKFVELAMRKGSDSAYDDAENGDNAIFQQLNIKLTDTVQQTLRLTKSLGLEVQPLTRSGTPEPFTVFSKFGIGRLDLYVVNPDEESKELAYIREKWGCDGKSINATAKTGIKLASGKEGESLISDLASICCLLVWHPFSPEEKILRVLFPGNAPQDKLFEGLEKLKHLDFLSTPCPTKVKLEKSKAATKTTRPTASKTKVFPGTKPTSTGSAKPPQSSAQSSKSSTSAKFTHASSVSRATASKSSTATAAKSSQQVASRSTVPLLSKVQTAASRPEKKTAAGVTKRPPSAAAKKQIAAKIEPSSSKTKRNATSVAISAEKRTKSEKIPSAKAGPSKPKPGPVHANAEARVKAKHATDKAAAKSAAASKETGKSTAKPATSKASTSAKTTKKQSSASVSKIGSLSPRKPKAGSNERKPVSKLSPSPRRPSPKASSPLPKVKTPLTPFEDLTAALSDLAPENVPASDKDKAAELWQRPSPEGQDEEKQGGFVEANGNLVVNAAPEKGDLTPGEKTDENRKEDNTVMESGEAAMTQKENIIKTEEIVHDTAKDSLQDTAKDSLQDTDTKEEKESISTSDFDEIHAKLDADEFANASTDSPCYDEQDDVLNREVTSEDFIGINSSESVQNASAEPPTTEGSPGHKEPASKEEEDHHDDSGRTPSDDFAEDLLGVRDATVPEEVETPKDNENILMEEQKENLSPEKPHVGSDHLNSDDSNQNEIAAVGDDSVYSDTAFNFGAPSPVHESTDKENVDPALVSTDQSTDPATSPSSNLFNEDAAAGNAMNPVLDEDQGYLEIEDHGHNTESAVDEVSPSSPTAPKLSEEKEISKEFHVQDGDLSQLDHFDNAQPTVEEYPEKEEIPLSDPPCSYSTTSTMSRRALLESPCSTELDSTYNIPSTVGSISVAIPATEPGNEQGVAQSVIDFYDDNGNRANDAWKSDIADLAAQYSISPIAAWSDGKEDQGGQIDGGAASVNLVEDKESGLDESSDEDHVALPTRADGETLEVRDEKVDITSCEVEENSNLYAEEEQVDEVMQDTVSVDVSDCLDVKEEGLATSGFQQDAQLPPVLLPELLPSPTAEHPLPDPDPVSPHQEELSSSAGEEHDQPSPEVQRQDAGLFFNIRGDDVGHETPVDVSINHDTSQEIDDSDQAREDSYRARDGTYRVRDYTSGSGSSYLSDSYSEQRGGDYRCEQNGTVARSPEESFQQSEPHPTDDDQSHEEDAEDNIRKHGEGSSSADSSDASPSPDFSHDLRQLHAGQNNVSDISSFEYDVTDDQKAALLRLSDEMYTDHVEKNPHSGFHPEVVQENVGNHEDGMQYMDVANNEDQGLDAVDHNLLKSGGAVSPEIGREDGTSAEDNDDVALVSDTPIARQSRDDEIDQSTSPFDPFQNQFVDKMPDDDDWLSSNKSFSPLDQSISHEGAYTFGANNPFVADIVAQNLNQEEEEDDLPPIRTSDPMMAQDRPATARTKKPANSTNGGKKNDSPPAFYVDLAYIPHHVNKNHCGVEFFKRIRSKYYVMSGFDASNDEPSGEALLGLLEGKRAWRDQSGSGQDSDDVTVIPTHNSAALHDWYEKHHRDLDAENVHLVASGSKVLMHNESIEACKIEF